MSAVNNYKRNWWALQTTSIITIAFGFTAVFWPGLNDNILVYLFGTYVFLISIFDLLLGLNVMGSLDTWFLPVILGLFELAVGIYLLRYPHLGFDKFILLIGFTLIVRGSTLIMSSYFDNLSSDRVRGLNYFSGVVGILIGLIVFFVKKPQGVSFVWLLAVYAVIVGTLQITAFASRLKSS
jgi:uncharacterized membrane protein HdeD (DUF308 family)